MPAAGVRVEFVRFGKRAFDSLEITVTSKKEQNKKKGVTHEAEAPVFSFGDCVVHSVFVGGSGKTTSNHCSSRVSETKKWHGAAVRGGTEAESSVAQTAE
jgi:hypothetical protein